MGRTAAIDLARTDHAKWKPAKHRDPLASLSSADEGRIRKLLPLKYARMAASPFAFYRGSVALMAADLASMPSTGISVQICGDAHVGNLGCFAAPDGQLVFDLNDFDETVQAPFEWDLKRLAVSLVLAAREARDKDAHAELAVRGCLHSYRVLMAQLSELAFLELMRYQVRHTGSTLVHDALRKAERSTPEHSLAALCTLRAKTLPQFHPRPPDVTRVSPALAKTVTASLRSYRDTLAAERQSAFDRYVPVDVALKVAGTSSIGLRDYVILLLGNGDRDALFLQVKQATSSAYATHLHQHAFTNEARRVVDGQRRMQFQCDPFFGWTTLEGRDFLVRQLSDQKAGIDCDDLRGDALLHYARVCGAVLAKSHARSGDPAVITGYCGENDKLDLSIARFAFAYANQVESDYGKFLKHLRRRKPAAKKKRQ